MTGLFLLFIGIAFLILSVKAVTKAYNSEYGDYKSDTPCILPFGHLKRLYKTHLYRITVLFPCRNIRLSVYISMARASTLASVSCPRICSFLGQSR